MTSTNDLSTRRANHISVLSEHGPPKMHPHASQPRRKMKKTGKTNKAWMKYSNSGTNKNRTVREI